MNQKNIFTVIAVLLVLRGISFYVMGDTFLADAFPNLDEIGKNAANTFLQVMSAMFILIGLITYAARNSPGMVWAYALGFTLFSINTLKHMFIDGINVPITALILQGGIALICIYLWFQQRNTVQ